MVTLLQNSLNGPAGTTITPANSAGLGSELDVVNGVSGGGTVAYDSTYLLHGQNMARLATAAGGSLAATRWTTSMGTQAGRTNMRGYYVYPELPASGDWRIYSWDTATKNCASIHILADGTINIRDVNADTILASDIAITPGSAFRLEGWMLGDPAAGQCGLQLYLEHPDGPVPDWEATSSADNDFTGAPSLYSFGIETTTDAAGPWWQGAIALSNGPAYIGSGWPQVPGGSGLPQAALLNIVLPAEENWP
ncbi:MAG TPA: hypothetical protein VGG25_31300 [Streptosporangiaceae bacterium]|jgi:hypothetical protein